MRVSPALVQRLEEELLEARQPGFAPCARPAIDLNHFVASLPRDLGPEEPLGLDIGQDQVTFPPQTTAKCRKVSCCRCNTWLQVVGQLRSKLIATGSGAEAAIG